MSDRYLRLLTLRLEGFGPYRGPWEFRFPPGLALLIGPNETGKSTLASAISAAFFGLPGTADPAAFGAGRYRNWDDPRRFEVALEFEVDGRLHRLRRNFDTHRVGLFRKESRGWRQLAGGEHNPNAKKPNAPFNRWLFETFGHASRELFEATFSLRQPFAAVDRMDGELQSLLSGGGSGHLGALDRLTSAAKALTHRTRELGLTPRDGRRQGRLDEVREAIRALTSEISEGRESLDELQRLSREIAELTGELDRKRERLASVRRSLSAFTAWRHQVQKVRDRGDDVAQVRRALQQVRRIEEELSRERFALEREFSEFEKAAAPLDEGFEQLSEALHRGAELGRLKGELAAIERALGEAKRAREELIPWEVDKEGALSWLAGARRAALDARKEWNAYLNLRSERKALLQRRMEEYRAFEEAAPTSLERIGEYRLARSLLVERLSAARERLAKEEARLAEARGAKERLAERYADVHGKVHLLGDVDRALQLYRELESAQEGARAARARLRSARRLRWGAAAGALALLFSLLSGSARAGVELRLAAAALFIAFALFIDRLPRFRRLRARLGEAEERRDQLERELDQVRRRLAPLGEIDPSALERLRSRLVSYGEALATLREAERGGPGPGLEQLREEVARHEEELAAFDREIAPFKEAHEDFEAAYSAWRKLQEESREVGEALRRLVRAWGWEGEDEPGPAGAPAGGVWADLLPFARPLWELVAGEAPREVEALDSLAALVERLDEATWSELRRRAESHDEALRREVELLAERRRLTGPDGGALSEAREELRRAVASLQRAWPGEWGPFLAALEGGVAGEEAAAALRLLPSPWREIVGRAGGLEEARRRYDAFRSAKSRIAQLAARREGALQAAGCSDETALERRLAEVEASLTVAAQELESLVREYPGLPPRGEEEEVEAASQRVGELEREAARLESELERGEGRVRELRRRQASLQGARPVNVARAELELAELIREEERLHFELRAIALAHAHLQEAAEAYYAGHLERLADGASAYFAAFTGRKGRRIAFDGEGRLLAVEADGRPIPLPALSQGAKDQLYLAFRLGVADLLSWNRALPFIFDDPFVHCDAIRLDSIRRALERLAEGRQILLCSHSDAFRTWGAPIEARELDEIGWEEEVE